MTQQHIQHYRRTFKIHKDTLYTTHGWN